MNIDNLRKELEQGDTFTYKKLCEVLEVEYNSGGNIKKKQLEDWDRYFEYEKVGTKIKILNIRDKELPDINKMLGKSKYYSDLETLILYALNETKNKDYLILSVNKALKFTNMVNQNYFLIIGNEESFCKQYDIDIEFLYSFKNLSRKKIKEIFENNLKTMEDKSLIKMNKVTMICEEKVINTSINEDGEVIYETRKIFRKATTEEDSIILNAGKKVLKEMGIVRKHECVKLGRWTEYITKVLEYVHDELEYIDFFYNAYEIISHKDIVIKEISEVEKLNAENSLNTKMCEAMSLTKNKLIKNKEMRESLVDILINTDTLINVKHDLLKARDVSDMTDYDRFAD